MEIPFINIHSHNLLYDNVLGYYNWDLNLIQGSKSPPDYTSIGLHPWFLKEDSWIFEWTKIQKLLCENPQWALGEIGLDRKCTTSFDLQKLVFKTQLIFAQQEQRVVILHSVKSYSDILEVLKNIKPTLPIIFHGYHGNINISNQLLNYNSYFSFGHGLLINRNKMAPIIASLPLDRLFFETDAKDIPIESIYNKASEILQISVSQLKEICYQNYLKLQP